MNKIRILVVAPNEEPHQLKILHTLKEMQKVVGGLIEYVELEHNVDLICNEEGKLLNLELNRLIGNDVIAGTFFIGLVYLFVKTKICAFVFRITILIKSSGITFLVFR